MSSLDWVVLGGTLLFIVVYGVWKTRGNRDMDNYLRGGNSMKWWTVGLSVMATQASAITFLSTPGLAFEDGLRFVQFYFGMPLALVIISITFIPIYYRLKVYTAYEYLESRFDVRTRVLGAMIFLVQRAMSAGITIYAPAIILSSALGWPLSSTSLVIGVAGDCLHHQRGYQGGEPNPKAANGRDDGWYGDCRIHDHAPAASRNRSGGCPGGSRKHGAPQRGELPVRPLG